MKEAKNIVVRWTEVKVYIGIEQARLSRIVKAVKANIVAACGQQVDFAGDYEVNGYTLNLCNQVYAQIPGCYAHTEGMGHWPTSIEWAEGLLKVLQGINARTVRKWAEDTL